MKSLRLSPLIALPIVVLTLWLMFTGAAQAANLANRSVKIDDPKPSAVTSHTISFDYASSDPVGSLVFEYCSNDPLHDSPCTAPAGLDLSGATLSNQTGETGFSIHPSSTANRLVLTRTPAGITNFSSQYVLSGVVNPSSNNSANYVRLGTHASIDGTGARQDEGGLAFRILTGISTEAYVPPFLLFCTGITVDLDCATANGSYLDLGELSANAPRAGTSQYAGATNDESGYIVNLFGTTMTSGNQVIAALTTPTFSQPGTSQFGLNVRANTNPDVGQDPVGGGSLTGSSDYNTSNLFKFVSGDILSSTPFPSDYNRFTVSYLVNISPNQAPGIYAATFTYLATATF